ncbi:aminotransferase class I/II-fold pyridoxal phosphate-dependent enzyme [Roseateles sp. DB2]|uniref:aminotransferase class I/II-fold pyridoxal phosphate-dependent enzyme n=1 Tax=Roseateles sp. DB2 TaxID=3453717 RepID=UPI003EED310D
MVSTPLLEHGGPDGGPPVRHDFSSNASPLSTPEPVLAAVQAADRRHYPDPTYGQLREKLASLLQHPAELILPSAGGAEAIRRLTLWAMLEGLRHVWVPQPGFGEYAAAAQALGLRVHAYEDLTQLARQLCTQEDGLPMKAPALVWVCDPCNPTGSSPPAAAWQGLADALLNSGSHLAIDLAYEALRLDGSSQLPASLAEQSWRLRCPNKALSLTGVRAGLLQAPRQAAEAASRVQQLAPSWVLSAEGVALLDQAWRPDTLQALKQQRDRLRPWRLAQHSALHLRGWAARPSVCNFALWRPGSGTHIPSLLAALRQRGIKLRNAESLGAPGWLRLSVQSPDSQDALLQALMDLECL